MKFPRIGAIFFFFVNGLIIGFLTILAIVNINEYFNHRQEQKTELAIWKKVVNKYPNSPDGWAKVATIWHNLNNNKLAGLAIKKARRLDPVREEIKKIEEKIIK